MAAESRAGMQSPDPAELPEDGRVRIVIEHVAPEVDAGRFPIKRIVGDSLVVEADAFTDGHDRIVCLLRHRRDSAERWTETPMKPLGNDRWQGRFKLEEIGRYRYTVTGWVDRFLSWRSDFARRENPDDIADALEIGATLVRRAAERADAADRDWLEEIADELGGPAPLDERRETALDPEFESIMRRHPDRTFERSYERELEVVVDRERARFSTWYELFPRSTTTEAGGHGTIAQCIERLPRIAELGFDVLYLPPIHPIGRANRKGPNNVLSAATGDPGSPWAIGAAEGGHKSVHPELGTHEELAALRSAARDHGIEIALDIAFQCAPDHPYVGSHPQWFRRSPSGAIQYAENPPKKYEDIYPFDFESEDWRAMWIELESIFEFWIEHGIAIFRVDNPHTKAFGFWEWAISRIKRRHPEVIFLSEAFTRPRVMHRLAKLGFTQSYTYFTWRNSKRELIEYMTELTQHESREYFLPNLWPNTPDILHEYLQFGGRPAFIARATLAATLSASYGIYGPAFELMEREPRQPGSEEYRDSEKYQIRRWDLDSPDSLSHFIARLNRIRRENAALHGNWSLRFHETGNEQLIAYSKATDELDNIIVTVVNLDPHYRQSGFLELPLADWHMDPGQTYQVHDLLSDARYLWQGPSNYVELDPNGSQAHVFRLRRRIGTEQDFDYFM